MKIQDVQVIIHKIGNEWILRLSAHGGQLYKVFSYSSLVKALEAAAILRLHVDNAETLPLRNYGLNS